MPHLFPYMPFPTHEGRTQEKSSTRSQQSRNKLNKNISLFLLQRKLQNRLTFNSKGACMALFSKAQPQNKAGH